MAMLFVFATVRLSAQITNMYSADSSLAIHQLYVGAVESINFSVDSMSTQNWTGLRVGSNATYTMNKVFSINAFFALDQNSDGYLGTINSFVLKTRIGKNFVWTNGVGAQVSALFHRPIPPSFSGHFEPWVKRQIPGVGFLTRFEVGSTNKLVGSIAQRNNQGEFHLGFNRKQKFLTSVWVNTDRSMWGGAVTLQMSKISTVLLVDQTHLGYFAWVTLPKDWGTYLDFGFDYKQRMIPRAEVGFLKSYKVTSYKLAGVVGMGYSYEQRAVRGYLTIALSD